MGGGGLADDEERASRFAVVEEVEHLARERGIALGRVGRGTVVFEIEGERDALAHQYASMSRNSKVSSASAVWSMAGDSDRRIRWSGEGCSVRGGWMPR